MPEPIRMPRIIPSGDHMQKMKGIWELDGEMVRLMAEPDTGVLVAVTTDGGRVNPIKVVSHGAKWEEMAEEAG